MLMRCKNCRWRYVWTETKESRKPPLPDLFCSYECQRSYDERKLALWNEAVEKFNKEIKREKFVYEDGNG